MAAFSDVVVGVFAAAAAGGGALLGSRTEVKKLQMARRGEEEDSFGVAKVGYRQCYRKLMVNLEAFWGQRRGWANKPVDLAKLLDNFWEAVFIGDHEVTYELEQFWPAAIRAEGKPPPFKQPPASLIRAIQEHGQRSLREQEEHQRKWKRPADRSPGSL